MRRRHAAAKRNGRLRGCGHAGRKGAKCTKGVQGFYRDYVGEKDKADIGFIRDLYRVKIQGCVGIPFRFML